LQFFFPHSIQTYVAGLSSCCFRLESTNQKTRKTANAASKVAMVTLIPSPLITLNRNIKLNKLASNELKVFDESVGSHMRTDLRFLGNPQKAH